MKIRSPESWHCFRTVQVLLKDFKAHKRSINKNLGNFPLLNGTVFSELSAEVRQSAIIYITQAEKSR
jgi:hypothetical protein